MSARAIHDPAAVVAAARGWIGTPYHDQASLRGVGADCLGLVRGVWRELLGPEPTDVPAYTRDWGEVGARERLREGALRWMIEAPVAQIAPGSVVLLRMRAGAIAKHCGIVTAQETFVHAYDRLGVIEEPLSPAWRRRIAFAFHYPAAPG